MSTAAPSAATDESRTIWKELTSAKGVTYRVGYQIPHDEDFDAAKALVEGYDAPRTQSESSTDDRAVSVHWTPDGKLHKTPQDVIDKVHITSYQFGKDTTKGSFFNYKFAFLSTVSQQLTFFEEGGDSFQVYVFDVGRMYNMGLNFAEGTQPVIVKIEAGDW
ncbi:hypothetical protein BJ165DRAFT_1403649 [Panaeolus papilionaceus]|nr:hypothetical protein BJ165DRAFT_1403649 [Panaeolus papilionaceus]